MCCWFVHASWHMKKAPEMQIFLIKTEPPLRAAAGAVERVRSTPGLPRHWPGIDRAFTREAAGLAQPGTGTEQPWGSHGIYRAFIGFAGAGAAWLQWPRLLPLGTCYRRRGEGKQCMPVTGLMQTVIYHHGCSHWHPLETFSELAVSRLWVNIHWQWQLGPSWAVGCSVQLLFSCPNL